MHVHIILVGTSLIRNLARDGSRYLAPEELDVIKEWASKIDDERSLSHIGHGPIFKGALHYVNETPKRASAELNALYSLLEEYDGLKIEKAILVRTDTHLGAFCSKVLSEHLKNYKPEEYVVHRLGKVFEEGIANLLDLITSLCREHRHDIVYLNATGGFKPESGIALLAAALGGAHYAYYMHEAFRRPRLIPLIPMIPDVKLLKQISQLENKPAEVLNELPPGVRARLIPLLEITPEKRLKMREWLQAWRRIMKI